MTHLPSDPAPVPQSIRFGEDFELDLRAYQLRRSGRTLKLERIPMEILLLLTEQGDSWSAGSRSYSAFGERVSTSTPTTASTAQSAKSGRSSETIPSSPASSRPSLGGAIVSSRRCSRPRNPEWPRRCLGEGGNRAPGR